LLVFFVSNKTPKVLLTGGPLFEVVVSSDFLKSLISYVTLLFQLQSRSRRRLILATLHLADPTPCATPGKEPPDVLAFRNISEIHTLLAGQVNNILK
jgi:hypothetical protein